MRGVRLSSALLAASAFSACGIGDPGFIPGTGTLPECSEAPTVDLTGQWFDQGTLTIMTAGCMDTTPGQMLEVCALDWRVTQTGRDVEMIVDEEYRIDGRVCGNSLHLRGGWWLATRDPVEGCTYEADTAAEVSIQSEGNVLAEQDGTMTGTLTVQSGCVAQYAMSLEQLD